MSGAFAGKPASIWQLRWRVLRRDWAAIAGLTVLILLALICGGAGWIEEQLGVSGSETDLLSRLDPPSGTHWLGTDEAGRDELMRLLLGGRVSLSIGLLGALGASLIGIVIGATAGYLRGAVDEILMRFTDFMNSLPGLPILIILAALDLGKLGLPDSVIRSGSVVYWRLVIIFILLGWTHVARLMRAATLAINERDYVMAARAQGASSLRILGVHILPNAISPVIVSTTLAIGRIILTESALSFLGVGIQPPATSWGSMLTNAQEMLGIDPLLAFYPGLMIVLTVVSINFLGDGLQRAFDPRSGALQRR